MKVALLVPGYVSQGVIAIADRIREEIGLHAVLAFEVPGPTRTRLSRALREWQVKRREPRERVRMLYGSGDLPQSPMTNESAITYARRHGVPSCLGKTLNDQKLAEAIRNSHCDVIVAVGAGIVGVDLLNLPNVVFVNAHPGRLPEIPGRDTAAWAVYLGQPVYGTVHRMAPRVDVGDVLVREPLDFGRPRTIEEFHIATWSATWELVVKALQGLQGGRLPFMPQNMDAHRRMYYRMHPELLRVVARRLADGSFFATQERCLAEFRKAATL